MSKVYGQDNENNGLPETRPAAQNMPNNQEFVRIVCPYPMITSGLARALEKAGIRYGAEPPLGGAPPIELRLPFFLQNNCFLQRARQDSNLRPAH